MSKSCDIQGWSLPFKLIGPRGLCVPFLYPVVVPFSLLACCREVHCVIFAPRHKQISSMSSQDSPVRGGSPVEASGTASNEFIDDEDKEASRAQASASSPADTITAALEAVATDSLTKLAELHQVQPSAGFKAPFPYLVCPETNKKVKNRVLCVFLGPSVDTIPKSTVDKGWNPFRRASNGEFAATIAALEEKLQKFSFSLNNCYLVDAFPLLLWKKVQSDEECARKVLDEPKRKTKQAVVQDEAGENAKNATDDSSPLPIVCLWHALLGVPYMVKVVENVKPQLILVFGSQAAWVVDVAVGGKDVKLTSSHFDHTQSNKFGKNGSYGFNLEARTKESKSRNPSIIYSMHPGAMARDPDRFQKHVELIKEVLDELKELTSDGEEE